MIDMAFKAMFVAHVPDAHPEKHRCVVETDTYKLFTVLVRNQPEAVEVCKRLVSKRKVYCSLLE
jgi:hypothetical protein